MNNLAVLALVVSLTPLSAAWAQSKKYPPVPPDKDREAENRSVLWESTINPDLKPYTDLVRAAEQHMSRNTRDELALAEEKLTSAIQKMPSEPSAYLVRGRLYLQQRDWNKCANDLGAAEDHTKDSTNPVARTKARIDLGVCQARAGRLADAESTLVRAAASAQSHRGELGMRLGEVRIALGKLDEAIAALTAALEGTDTRHELTRWLLAAAYDRARKPTEALEQAQIARSYDSQRTYIESPTLPLLGAGDQQYLLGVAYRYATPKPEYALLYFRQFIKLAPDSPWRRRAEEHVRDLSAMKLPARETITSTGSATFDVEVMRSALEQPMRVMRKCLARTPMSAFQVTITKVGPKTPETRDRPLYRLPSPSTRVAPILSVGERAAEPDMVEANKCLDIEVAKLKLPPPKEKDTWYMMSFIVVSP
jgi:tetratricopeptide (TPR) repeat protein